ncbi:MAG: hypothetical protein HY731_12410 [Candidatus Tectomicrobia bacterium]|nr:hypothetical protein [Candidatus Tectomicrobia bacterium]
MLTLAQELAHPYSLAWALSWTAMLHQFRREGQATQERAEALMALSTKQGFASVLTRRDLLRGWALVEQGQQEEGMAQMHQSLPALQTTGVQRLRPAQLALLAEACEKARHIEEGLSVLTEALAAVHRSGERWWEAELYRLKGELLGKGEWEKGRVGEKEKNRPLTRSPTHSSPEECFLQAIDIARRQSARSLELRAVVSLSRLWQQQGKKEEARQILAEIYRWFTEGFDTADLKGAKALLGELEGTAANMSFAAEP